uniref:Uncharacterized protein n=1 Tax=Fagus sylvatica TaxID=28930 RepID=A0A2N9E2G8_FAGSY
MGCWVGCGVARGGFVGWLAEVVVGLWGGLLRWCSESRGLQVGFWLIPVGVWFTVGQGRLRGGSWWVCGVACRGGGRFVGWLAEVVQ